MAEDDPLAWIADVAAGLGLDAAEVPRVAAILKPLPTLARRLGYVGDDEAAERVGLVWLAMVTGASNPKADVMLADAAIRDVWARPRGLHERDAFEDLPKFARSVAAIVAAEMPQLRRRAGFDEEAFRGLVWEVLASVSLVALGHALGATAQAFESGDMLASEARALGPEGAKRLAAFADADRATTKPGRRADLAARHGLLGWLILTFMARGLGDEVSTYGDGTLPRLLAALVPALELPALPSGKRDRRAVMQRFYRAASLPPKATPGRPRKRR